NQIQPDESVVFAVQASGITIGTAPYTFDDLPRRLRRMMAGDEAPRKLAAPPPWRPRQGTGRVRIESIGVVPEDATPQRDSIELARLAGEDCFSRSNHERTDI